MAEVTKTITITAIEEKGASLRIITATCEGATIKNLKGFASDGHEVGQTKEVLLVKQESKFKPGEMETVIKPLRKGGGFKGGGGKTDPAKIEVEKERVQLEREKNERIAAYMPERDMSIVSQVILKEACGAVLQSGEWDAATAKLIALEMAAIYRSVWNELKGEAVDTAHGKGQ